MSRFNRFMEGMERVVAAPAEGMVRLADKVSDRYGRNPSTGQRWSSQGPPSGRMMTPPHLNPMQFQDTPDG
jgi:hypothetical protein